MQKLIDLLTVKALKGIRTKISLLVAGVLGIATTFGYVSPEQNESIMAVLVPLGLYFFVEHEKD